MPPFVQTLTTQLKARNKRQIIARDFPIEVIKSQFEVFFYYLVFK